MRERGRKKREGEKKGREGERGRGREMKRMKIMRGRKRGREQGRRVGEGERDGFFINEIFTLAKTGIERFLHMTIQHYWHKPGVHNPQPVD